MHGRVKVRTTAEQEAIKKVERAKKLAQYRTYIAIVFEKRESKTWDNELLAITERMLLQNPDIYTLWNIRREAFENIDWNNEDNAKSLENELTLTQNCLRENPKSYSIWHQRCWVIERMKQPDWEKELALCAQCLNLDERNFHCWDYRQYLVEKAGISDTKEFDFSTQKILTNFSNYSSWHYRSKILSKMFQDHLTELKSVKEKHGKELRLVMDATFTDPNDSSAWFYQRWLLDQAASRRSMPSLWRASIIKDTGIIVFDKDVCVAPGNITLHLDDMVIDAQWDCYKHRKFAKIWTVKLNSALERLDAAKCINITFQGNVYEFHYSNVEKMWLYKTNEALRKDERDGEQLCEQLRDYKELVRMEPNNKWTLLTAVFLMKKIDFMGYYEEILKDLNSLMNIDSLRRNYYRDLRSKYVVENALHEIWKKEDNLAIEKKIDLSKLDLTALSNNENFGFFKEIDLDANELDNSLHQLSTFQECAILTLSNNQLTSVKHFPTLHSLKVLSLRNNKLANEEEILHLIRRHDLMKLDLRENPICDMDIASSVAFVAPALELCIK